MRLASLENSMASSTLQLGGHASVWHHGTGDHCILELGAAVIDFFRSRKRFRLSRCDPVCKTELSVHANVRYRKVSASCTDWPHHSFYPRIPRFSVVIAAQRKE